MVDGDTSTNRRREVLAIAGIIVVVCAVIAAWPAGAPAATLAQAPPAHELEPAVPAIAPQAPDPQRHEVATQPDVGVPPADDATTVRVAFDTFDTLVARRPVFATTFGPADGAAQLTAIHAPLVVRVHAASPEWLIHDGLLRRVRGTVGQMLRLPLGEVLNGATPRRAVSRFDSTLKDVLALPSALAQAQFREVSDQADATVAFVGLVPNSTPAFRVRVDALTIEGVRAKDLLVFVTDTATGQLARGTSKNRPFDEFNLVAGTYTVRAASPVCGRAERIVALNADTTIQLVLQRGPEVCGRVVDRDGVPVAGSRIVWIGNGEYRNQVLTADDGSFAVQDVGGAVGAVWACVPGDGVRLPAAGRLTAPGEAIELVIDRQRCRCSLQVRVAVPDGVPMQDVTGRLWQQASELGVRLLVNARPGDRTVELTLDDIPAGHYRVELHCPGFGAIDAGTHWLDGTGPVVLDVALPAPAHVTFALPAGTSPPAANAFELVRIGAAVDMLIPTAKPFAGPHVLGPGRYTIWWRDPSGVRSHGFTITAAGPQTIDLPD